MCRLFTLKFKYCHKSFSNRRRSVTRKLKVDRALPLARVDAWCCRHPPGHPPGPHTLDSIYCFITFYSCYMSFSAVVVCSKQASPFLRKQPYFLVGLIMMCVILNFILFPVIASFQRQCVCLTILGNEAMKLNCTSIKNQNMQLSKTNLWNSVKGKRIT